MIADYCEAEGFEVALAYVGNEGVQQAIEGGYDLVLLAVVLPGTNGLDVLQGIRSKLDTPVILLANPAQRKLHAAGLELGADDFVEKSVEPRVLLARIRALIRRTKSHHRDDLRPTPGRMILGDIELDAGGRTVRRNEERLRLTSVEFDLMEILIRAAGHVVSREHLSQSVLGHEIGAYDRSLDMHVSRLRKKTRSSLQWSGTYPNYPGSRLRLHYSKPA